MKKKGVISIYSCVSLILVISLILALLESARIYAIKSLMPEHVDLSIDNCLSNYQRTLYKECGILGLDGNYSRIAESKGTLEELIVKELNGNYQERRYLGVDFLKGEKYGIDEMKYRLISDDEGEVFLRYLEDYYKSIWSKSRISEIAYIDAASDYTDMPEIDMANNEAVQALEEAGEYASSLYVEEVDNNGNTEKRRTKEYDQKMDELRSNDISLYQNTRSTPILTLIFGKKNDLSKGIIDKSHMPSIRKLSKGDMEGVEDRASKLYTVFYCRQEFDSYLDNAFPEWEDSCDDETSCNEENMVGTDSILYEQEYLIGGKETDIENLEVVLTRLLILREGIRFSSMLIDEEKMAEAEAMALMLVGFTGQPLLVEAVKVGIILAWSFSEAVQDVRDLVNGKKVPLFISSSLENEEQIGLGYNEYLLVFISLLGRERLAYRAMDVIENRVNRIGEKEFYMDDVIIEVEGKVSVDMPFLFAKAMLLIPSTIDAVSTGVYFKKSYVTGG